MDYCELYILRRIHHNIRVWRPAGIEYTNIIPL